MFDVIMEEEPKAEDDDVNHDDLEDGGMETIDAGEGEGGNPRSPSV